MGQTYRNTNASGLETLQGEKTFCYLYAKVDLMKLKPIRLLTADAHDSQVRQNN